MRAVTKLYITIDTEYDFAFARRWGAGSRAANFDRAIAGRTASGEVGIAYQMDVLDRHRLKAVFFVDPMPALIWGTAAIEDVVGPIITRGHDVQLHIHTEWLEIAGSANPLGGRSGRNVKDFSFDEQCRLMDYARSTLIAAGAPAPVAFRAGNYGANDDTLHALAALGMVYDTSHCPGIAGSHCAISLTARDRAPIAHCGVIEVPIGCIGVARGALRHAQLTAISAQEIIAALRHCQAVGRTSFTLVSHSFELMSRDRAGVNQIVKRRFEQLCSLLATTSNVTTATYADNPLVVSEMRQSLPPLPHSPLRSGRRLVEQAISSVLYGRYTAAYHAAYAPPGTIRPS